MSSDPKSVSDTISLITFPDSTSTYVVFPVFSRLFQPTPRQKNIICAPNVFLMCFKNAYGKLLEAQQRHERCRPRKLVIAIYGILNIYTYTFYCIFLKINLYFVCPINCVLIEISHNFPHESSLEAKVSIFQKV